MNLRLLSALFLSAAAFASAQTVVFDDTFEDVGANGSTTNDDAFDASDLQWYSSLSPGAINTANDTFAGGSSNRALTFTSGDAFRRFGANFTSTTLNSTIGSKIVLSFDMRLSEAPANNQWGFRFGLFDGGGNWTSGNNTNGINQPPEENNDFGYHVRFATGNGTIFNEIYEEPAGNNPLGGADPFGGNLISTSSGNFSINDQTKHSFVFELERTANTTITMRLSYDNNGFTVNATDSSPYTTFDTIYFGQGGISTDFLVDNVKLTSSIPEPSTGVAVLAGFGAFALLRRRRGF